MIFQKSISSILLLLLLVGCLNEQQSSHTASTNAKSAEPSDLSEVVSDTLATRFEEAIKAFEKEDQQRERQAGAVLFTGSSSIRLWSTLGEDMMPHSVLNRGFGGSTIPEVIHYFDRIALPHQPGAIVLYCGENDIADGQKAEQVFDSFQNFIQRVRHHFPQIPIGYISMKPSIARWDMWPEFEKGNQLIKEFIEKDTSLLYMDSSLSMLDKQGQIRKDIFIEDGLHMNAKGYEGWTKLVRPTLEIWAK